MKDIMRTVESDSERDGDDSESDVNLQSDACVSDSLLGGMGAAAAARSSRARFAASAAFAAFAIMLCSAFLLRGMCLMMMNCRCRRSNPYSSWGLRRTSTSSCGRVESWVVRRDFKSQNFDAPPPRTASEAATALPLARSR